MKKFDDFDDFIPTRPTSFYLFRRVAVGLGIGLTIAITAILYFRWYVFQVASDQIRP